MTTTTLLLLLWVILTMLMAVLVIYTFAAHWKRAGAVLTWAVVSITTVMLTQDVTKETQAILSGVGILLMLGIYALIGLGWRKKSQI